MNFPLHIYQYVSAQIMRVCAPPCFTHIPTCCSLKPKFLLNIVVFQAWFLGFGLCCFFWQSAFYLLPLRVLFGPWFYKSDWWWFYKGRGFWIFTPVGFNQTEFFTKLPLTFLFPPGLQSGREEYSPAHKFFLIYATNQQI